jgi:uncharacterized membrane protein
MSMKKALVIAAFTFVIIAGTIDTSTDANAVVCARGPYRAGCAGPRGAVGVHRGYYGGYRGGVYRRGYYGGGVYRRY